MNVYPMPETNWAAARLADRRERENARFEDRRRAIDAFHERIAIGLSDIMRESHDPGDEDRS